MMRFLKHKRESGTVAFIIVFIVFAIYSLSLIYPLFWAFITSFKDEYDYLLNRVGFPEVWYFTNYSDAFVSLSSKGRNLLTMFFNSFWFAFGGTFIAVFVSTMSAYVVAKYRFFGRRLFYALALVIMMLPIVGALPSQYEMYSRLNILNSPALLVIYANGMGFNFLVLYGYFSGLPWDYVEASFIDGGNHFNTFFRIMLPQAKSSVLALSVVAFINIWNDYNTPILFLESYPTLSSGIYLYQADTLQHNVDIPMLFAGVFMSVIPILALFIAFQDKIMSITIGGGLKG